MKKVFFFILLAITCGCNDGDLQIETLDFDSVSMETCTTATTSTTIFFKINDDEALILDLESGLFKNEVSDGSISSSIPSESNLLYRIFSDSVDDDYFCDAIPTTEPRVTDEIEALSGDVLITTTQLDSITYQHTIQLSEISLMNSNGERITDLTINEFGTFTTTAN
ncbi:hypothetical protein [Croceivirga lutea]|uniref:hypothetical protein n=1 Tax=Croceivirga lutea TaxID=1775167 RepID=UPI00163B0CAB|nr:hypothetical protein [Croceivirga lutea]